MAHSFTDNTRGPRLQKVMAEAGVASRRECEALIAEGHVTVNGERVTDLPAWVSPIDDRVEVDGMPLRRPRPTDRHTYLLLHKPKNIISTARDDLGRTTVLDLVRMPDLRLYPVGRLDAESTGLMLLTDDGRLTQALTHPSYEVNKRYEVSIVGKLNEADIAKMKKGLYLAPNPESSERRGGTPNPWGGAGGRGGSPGPRRRGQRRASVESVRVIAHQTDRTRGDQTKLEITLAEGQNREIRRLLARLGFKVKRLKRTGIGPLRLKGLGPGEWRPLGKAEVDQLYKAAGVKR